MSEAGGVARTFSDIKWIRLRSRGVLRRDLSSGTPATTPNHAGIFVDVVPHGAAAHLLRALLLALLLRGPGGLGIISCLLRDPGLEGRAAVFGECVNRVRHVFGRGT